MGIFKSIIGDFWSTAQKHNAQFFEYNSLIPSSQGDLLQELHGQTKWKLCTSSESKFSEKCCQKILCSLALIVWNNWYKCPVLVGCYK